MTDYVVPPDSGPFTLVDNDTLTVTSVGSVIGTGVAAVTWDLNAGNTAPGIVIFNEGQISSTVRAIDTIDPSPGNSQVSLTNHGTITSANDAFRINNSLTDGVVLVDNHGSITTTGAGSGQAIDFAAVTAATSITITNRAGGLIQAADADAMRPGSNAVVNNYGDIVGATVSNDSDGIDGQNNAGITVNNYATGSIQAARHAITGNAPIAVNNWGEILGNLGSGINLDTLSTDTTAVTNHGTITGTAGGTSDGDGVDVDGLVNLNNHGFINALGTATGQVSDGVTVGGGTIVNHENGVIFSTQRGINIGDSDGGDAFAAATITNFGRIESGNGESIIIVGTFADIITNHGDIVGGINTGGGNDTINLFADSTTLGPIDGGDGTADEISLQGTGSGNLTSVFNIELLEVLEGNWTITDDQTYSSGIMIFSGASLAVGEGFAAGSVNADVVTNGVFAINRSDEFTVTGLIEGNGSFQQLGTGTTILDQTNGYEGGTLLTGGALKLSALGAAGTGAVIFDDGGQKLILDDEALTGNNFDNDVSAFGFGDAVDFSGLAFTAGTKVTYDEANGLVTVNGKNGIYSFTVLNPAETAFTAESDGTGGTQVILKNVGVSIRGTSKNDVVDGQKTVLGQPLPTLADDSIDVRRGNDKVDGLTGNDDLFGGDGNDNLAGSDGDDWLYGGTGCNKLSGGEGFNAFVFDTKLGKGKGADPDTVFTFSKIKDFAAGDNQILLDSLIFKALEPGPLSPDAFAIGKKAKSADVHILYKNGEIRYDKDGEGGKAAVLFAKVDPTLAIDAGDFLVI